MSPEKRYHNNPFIDAADDCERLTIETSAFHAKRATPNLKDAWFCRVGAGLNVRHCNRSLAHPPGGMN
jgi:hypothetical protein